MTMTTRKSALKNQMNRRIKPIHFDYAAQKKGGHDPHQTKRTRLEEDLEIKLKETRLEESRA